MIDTLLANQHVAAAIVFCLAAGFGQLLHAVKKWAEGTAGSTLEWLLGNPRRTVAAMIGNVSGMIVFIQTGVLGPMTGLPNGWWAIFLFGFMNGYSFDSALNRAARQANAVG